MGFGSERIWTKVGLVKAGTQPGTTAGALVMLPSPGQGRPCCCHGAGLGQASYPATDGVGKACAWRGGECSSALLGMTLAGWIHPDLGAAVGLTGEAACGKPSPAAGVSASPSTASLWDKRPRSLWIFSRAGGEWLSPVHPLPLCGWGQAFHFITRVSWMAPVPAASKAGIRLRPGLLGGAASSSWS